MDLRWAKQYLSIQTNQDESAYVQARERGLSHCESLLRDDDGYLSQFTV